MRVLRLTWVLFMTFAALVVVASVVGGMSPRERVIGVLDADCPMPCWQGIRPGVTDVDAAISLLAISPFVDTRFLAVAGAPGDDWWQITWTDSSRRNVYLWGALIMRGDVVHRIDVNFSADWPATVEDVIGLLGMPSYMVVQGPSAAMPSPRASSILLFYPEAGLEVAAHQPTWESSLWTAMRVGRLSIVEVNPDGPPIWDRAFGDLMFDIDLYTPKP